MRSGGERLSGAALVAVAAALGGALGALLPGGEPGQAPGGPAPLMLAGAAALGAAVWLRRRRGRARERRLGLEALMRSAQHGVVVFDQRRVVVEWSSGAADLFGYSSSEMVGSSLDRLIARHDRERFVAEVGRVGSELSPPGRFGVQGIDREGRALDLELFMAAWQARRGRMLGAVLHDVSRQRRVERRLGEAEKNWRDIAENSSDVLLLVDRAGTIIFANRGLLEKSAEQIIGDNVVAVVPHLAGALERALETVFVEGSPFEHEGESEQGAGKSWLWCRFAPQREDGEVARAVLSISDLSERRARDLQLRRLAGIMANTRDAVLTTDAEGYVTSWNHGAELLWGWTREEIEGRPISSLVPPERHAEQRAIFERARAGRHIEPFDSVALARNLRRIPLSISLASIRSEDGAFEGISAVARDMSHYSELHEAQERAKSAAETANRLKSAFIANMSHEVRTPLNGVVGMADLLRDTPLSAEQAGYVGTLLEACEALRAVVDDVLDFSKIEAGQLSLTRGELELCALVEAVAAMFRPAALDNGTRLSVSLPPEGPLPVSGDAHRLRQVLSNLVSNAVKFSPDGRVDIGLTILAETASRVRVRLQVTDTGVGIRREAQARLFQPFARADDSTTRRFGGTGLGLAICRRLAELMGGSIGFQSEEGQGSQFWLELQLDKVTSAPSHRAPAAPLLPRNDGGRVLVAEDNLINQKVVVAMLRQLGCSVDLASDGVEAVARWRAGVYDLVLMDCQMPRQSGFEATEIIRGEERGARTPIIAMTAQAYARDRERCIECGMDDHLAKPLTKSALQGVLARWLRQPRAAPEALTPAVHGLTLDTAALQRLESELGEGGQQLLVTLIDELLLDFPRALGRLDAALAAADWRGLAAEAHRLRSSTGSLAAGGLAELCKALEACGQRADAARARALMTELRGEFERARDALGRWCSARSARGLGDSDPHPTSLDVERQGVPS